MAARALRTMFLAESRLFLRDPFSLFFTLFFPVLLLLLFGAVYGSYDIGSGYRYVDAYVPALFATVIGNLALMEVPITLASYRDVGILRRYQATPIPTWWVLLVQVLVKVCMFFVSALLIIVCATLVFGLRFGGNPLLVLLAVLLSLAAMFALGMVLAGMVPDVRAAQMIGSALFFVMLFTSGAALPREEFPPWLRSVTEFVPLTQAVELLTGLWLGAPLSDHRVALVSLTALFVVAALIAGRVFRWRV
ncbi:MAG: ABC transporter permease [Oscillochloridaceae bacterium]|nr:ABC transporter permease [Chloroflexaceae bacterium]MDW8390349.1 ABC transporter permease [Oscillochloridaceae bacterium]